jgi:hypothetical protein
MTKHEKAFKDLISNLDGLEQSVKSFKSKLEYGELSVTDYTVMAEYQNLLLQMGSLSWYCTAYAKEQVLTEERIAQDLGVA